MIRSSLARYRPLGQLTGSIDLSLSAVGTYGALQAFLTEVEKVRDFSMSKISM